MPVIDKYLRNRHSATGTLDHFLALATVHADIGLFKPDILFLEQGFCAEAETAGEFCIYFNFRHNSHFLPSACKWPVSETNSSNRYTFSKLSIFKFAYNPGPAENEHLFCPRLFEQSGARIAGRSAGIDIVYQNHGLAGDPLLRIGRCDKCRANGSLSLDTAHSSQGRRDLAASNSSIVHRDAGDQRKFPADQDRLVKTAVPQARWMERHRNNDPVVRAFGGKFLQMMSDQSGQSQPSAIFQTHCNQRTAVIVPHHGSNPVMNRRLEKAFGTSAVVGLVESERRTAGSAPWLGKKVQLLPAR